MYPGTFSADHPNRVAVVMEDTGESLTYRELDEQSIRLARALHERGLRPQDGVVLISPNHLNCFVAYWAAARSGLYFTALNTHLAPAEARSVLENCAPRAVIASAELHRLAGAVSATSSVQTWMSFDGHIAGTATTWEPLENVLRTTSAAPLPDQPKGRDMLYSSGTTGGTPKGIRPPLPGTQVGEPGDYLVDTLAAAWNMGADSIYLSPAPLYHGGPLRFAAMLQMIGGTTVVLRKFDPERALAAIETYRCTHSQWVPTMFVRMLKLPGHIRGTYDLSSMQHAIHSSAPCPPQVKQAMIGWWGPILEEYYASQEAAGITLISSREWLDRPGSVGKAVLGEVRICGPLGEVLEAGEIGQIYFARDELPFVYHKNPQATREAQHPEHPSWTTPGDIGYVDEDGYLYLTDRARFMIISGGVNIYPQEIENELALHPAVHDVAVVGAPDEELGEVVTAVVQVAVDHEPGPALAEELRGTLEQSLARYKVPRHFHFVQALPRTPTGKLAKSRLAESLGLGTGSGS